MSGTKMLSVIDTPQGLILTDIERSIIEALASGQTPKDIALELGIPRTAVVNLMRKPSVAEFIQEIVDARNQAMKMYLPDLLTRIIEDKIAKHVDEAEDGRMADLTKKDVIDIARQLNDMLKTTGSETKEVAEDKLGKIYQQINIIQNGEGS